MIESIKSPNPQRLIFLISDINSPYYLLLIEDRAYLILFGFGVQPIGKGKMDTSFVVKLAQQLTSE